MSRLITCGFEEGAVGATAAADTVEGQGFQAAGTPAVETAIKRSGDRAMRYNAFGDYHTWPIPAVSGRTYFARAAVYVVSRPNAGSGRRVITFADGTNILYNIILNPDGSFSLLPFSGGSVIGTSPVVPLNTWCVLQLSSLINVVGGDNAEARLNGTTFASETNVARNTSVANFFAVGHVGSATDNMEVIIDDVAVNDDQGSAPENTFPNWKNRIVMLRPVADSARGANWTAGGTTGALWEAVNNVPPQGVATANDSPTSQIRNEFSDATGNYDTQLRSYTEAGIATEDTIKLVQAAANIGSNDISAATNGALSIVSNPVQGGEDSINFSGASLVAGVYASGWRTRRGGPFLSPGSITKSTRPVLRIGKRTATTRHAMCDMMGLYVEYEDGPPPAPTGLGGTRDNVSDTATLDWADV
jgi:hypothetical protein